MLTSELRSEANRLGGRAVGLTCLADGADTMFARAVARCGWDLEVVVPAEQYRESLPPEHWPSYDAFLAMAVKVHRLPFVGSTPEAHLAAGQYMVDHCDALYAVWDGEPARGPGGTADIVAYAHERGCPVKVVWPEGVHR
ncbi:hypothetical protein [Salinactinospora qingdaonensis]